jgi:low affinity Fe/Cu permease
MEERSPAAEDRASRSGQSPFASFVSFIQRATSGPGFFFVCVTVVLAWVASFSLWHDVTSWQAAIHTVASVLTLLLLVLQENATRRSDETVQEKLNVLAEGLAELMEAQGQADAERGAAAAARLRQAVALEGRH